MKNPPNMINQLNWCANEHRKFILSEDQQEEAKRLDCEITNLKHKE